MNESRDTRTTAEPQPHLQQPQSSVDYDRASRDAPDPGVNVYDQPDRLIRFTSGRAMSLIILFIVVILAVLVVLWIV